MAATSFLGISQSLRESPGNEVKRGAYFDTGV